VQKICPQGVLEIDQTLKIIVELVRILVGYVLKIDFYRVGEAAQVAVFRGEGLMDIAHTGRMGDHPAGPGGAGSGCAGNENPPSALQGVDEFASYGHVPPAPV
jgi:hypothetical protein